MTRTVVKANFRQARGRAGSGLAHGQAHGQAQASADYYSTRPNAQVEYQQREGFSVDASGLNREAVGELLEEAEGQYLYRAVLSPGEELEGEALEEWTRDVMGDFDGAWVAYAHEDQTDHAHVHVIAFTDEKLDRADFQEMRELGDRSYERLYESEREWDGQLEPDRLGRSPELEHSQGFDLE